MSRAGPGRRRRGRRSGGALAGDPLELFLDAITNALGAIMFILLMVLIFRPDDPSPRPVDDPSEVARLRSEIADARRRIDADRPRGDPALRARYDAAMQRFLRSQEESTELRSRLADAEQRLAAAALRGRQRTSEVTDLESAAPVPMGEGAGGTGFVRVGVFNERDERAPVWLPLNAGRLSRLEGLTEQSVIEPPGPLDGLPAADGPSSLAAASKLLQGVSPSESRVELFVWAGNYRAAKHVQDALRQLGFDWNVVLLEAGERVEHGRGGVQD